MATAPGSNQVVELLFKVAGGASLNGLSGKGIKDDISNIVSELQKQSVTELTFKVSDESLKSIRDQIKKSVQNISVTFNGKNLGAGDDTPSSSGGSKKTSDEKRQVAEVVRLYREYYSLLNKASGLSIDKQYSQRNAALKSAASTYDLISDKLKEYNIEASKTPQIQEAINNGYRKLMQTYNMSVARQADSIKAPQMLTSQVPLEQLSTKFTNLQKQINNLNLYNILPQEQIYGFQNSLDGIQVRFENLAGSSTQFANSFKNIKESEFRKIADDASLLEFSLERATEEAKLGSAEITKYQNSFTKLANRAQDYLTKITPSLKRSPEMFAELNNLVNQLRSGEGFSSVTEGSLAFQDLQFRIKQAGLETQTLGQQIEDIFKNKLGYGIIATAALYARSTMRELVSTVIELDTKLTELQIVSGESGQTMVKYMDDAAEGAKRVAASITDIIDATTVFRRLGFELQDSLNFAELTTMYSKVGGVEIGEAEANITAIIKAFELSTSDLELALDKMVTTGKVYCPTA